MRKAPESESDSRGVIAPPVCAILPIFFAFAAYLSGPPSSCDLFLENLLPTNLESLVADTKRQLAIAFQGVSGPTDSETSQV